MCFNLTLIWTQFKSCLTHWHLNSQTTTYGAAVIPKTEDSTSAHTEGAVTKVTLKKILRNFVDEEELKE